MLLKSRQVDQCITAHNLGGEGGGTSRGLGRIVFHTPEREREGKEEEEGKGEGRGRGGGGRRGKGGRERERERGKKEEGREGGGQTMRTAVCMALFTRRDTQTPKPVSHDTRNVFLSSIIKKHSAGENWGNPLETMLGFK